MLPTDGSNHQGQPWHAGVMPRTGTAHWIHRARELATGVLAPAAMRVEASQRVPPEHLDLLAAEGFYGLAGPREAGGLDVPFAAASQIIEILAGACLSTTFVWMQHHGVVRAVAGTANTALRQAMLGPLCRGERRAGRGPGRPAAGAAPAARPGGRGRVRARRDLAVGHRLGLHRHPARGRPPGGRHHRVGRAGRRGRDPRSPPPSARNRSTWWP